MATTLDLRIDAADAAIRRVANDLGERTPKAAVWAMNRAMQARSTEIVRGLSKPSGLTATRVRHSVKFTRATWRDPVAVIRITGRPIPAIAFNARQTARGVSVRAGSGRELIERAFIARMPATKKGNRHTGVFRRDVASTRMSSGAWSKNLPIAQQYRKSLPAWTRELGLIPAQHAKLYADFVRNLESQKRYILTGSSALPPESTEVAA